MELSVRDARHVQEVFDELLLGQRVALDDFKRANPRSLTQQLSLLAFLALKQPGPYENDAQGSA
jgi:hypothetical protein